MTWYVVHVQAGRELFAAGLLERNLEMAVYFPEVIQPRHGRRQRMALFPGYLFVDADWAHTAPGDVDRTPGVIRLVRGGDGIAEIGAAHDTQVARRIDMRRLGRRRDRRWRGRGVRHLGLSQRGGRVPRLRH